MSVDYNDTTPQDAYLVIAPNRIFDLAVLLDLYQPIIGVEAANLYLTLHNGDKTTNVTSKDARLHRHLVTASNLSFPALIKAREMLEAVGLLQTRSYKKANEEKYLFEYRLQEPLTGHDFFSSDVLSLILYNRIGEKRYLSIREQYAGNLDWTDGEYLLQGEITKSFDDVFGPIKQGDYKSFANTAEPLDSGKKQLKNPAIRLRNNYLNIEFIKGLVSNLHNLEKSLDEKLIIRLNELAFLYQYLDLEIARILNDPYVYDANGMIDEQLLRERALEMFRASGKELAITNQKDEAAVVAKAGGKLTKAERHRQALESYSPIQLIQQYQGKGMIANADLKIIDSLLYEYQLSPPVTNVLLEYVMLTNDYRLSRNLIEKIAAHWKRLGLSTVDQAMNAAKKENQLYLDWTTGKTSKNSAQTGKGAKQNKREQLPDYIVQQDERYHQSWAEEHEDSLDPERLAEIERLLKGLN